MNYDPDMFDGIPPRPLEERRNPAPWWEIAVVLAAFLVMAMVCLVLTYCGGMR